MSRGVGAALVAAAVVLSGCGSAQESVTTTSPSPETPVNPWDLPLEERPALFDPCAEIPVEAIEEALGDHAEPLEQFTRHQPGELLVCGWENEDLDLSVLSTWKSHEEYLNDPAITIQDADSHVAGRSSVRAAQRRGSDLFGCIQLLFTERGTVWLRSELRGVFEEYKGERFADPCKALEDISPGLVKHIPTGDFR